MTLLCRYTASGDFGFDLLLKLLFLTLLTLNFLWGVVIYILLLTVGWAILPFTVWLYITPYSGMKSTYF